MIPRFTADPLGKIIGRREFIGLLGGATATWPLAARAAANGVYNRISALSKLRFFEHTAKFNRGLNEMDFVDGQNLAIEYCLSDGRYEQLPAMEAKAVTTTILIVFVVSFDTIAAELVRQRQRSPTR